MNGGEAVVRTLQCLGVSTVFGIPSVHNLPIVDAMGRFKAPRFVVTRHEQGAAAMADAFARIDGSLGVFLTSTGPGATNAVTGLLEAELGCSPVLHLTSEVPTTLLGRGKGTTHEIRAQHEMLRTVCKDVRRVLSAADLPGAIREGSEIARSGKPGPVTIEIPIDVQSEELEDTQSRGAVDVQRPGPTQRQLEQARDLIAASRRIVIWSGGGSVRARAAKAITALAERLGAGVVTSQSGRGVIDEAHPLALGPLTTDPEIRTALEEADLWIAIGTRFRGESTDDWRLAPPKAILHINIDPSQSGRNYRPTLFWACDAKAATEALLTVVEPRHGDEDTTATLGARSRSRVMDGLAGYAAVVDVLEDVLPADAVLVRDVTLANFAFGSKVLRVHSESSTIYPATGGIGLGLPLAVGAKAAAGTRPVVLICGDGGFMLNLGELATMVQADLPVTMVLFNDRSYEILRRLQDVRFDGRHTAVDLNAPDFVSLAGEFGIPGQHIASAQSLRQALSEAIRSGHGAMLEVDVSSIGPIPYTARR